MNFIDILDIPDPDVVRVGDTYYLVTTTMHFMPGCEILASKDLINWEHQTYLYDTLENNDAHNLVGDKNIYGKGMWAATIRYHKDTFYVCFVANDTHKTYLFTSKDINGPWDRKEIEGFYHDLSLLFDDDGKVYIAYGNREIWITELKSDLSGPMPGGFHKLVVNDKDNKMLGYEGTHFYKIDGKYYLFFIHSLSDRWRRVEACFVTDSLEKDFTGGDVFDEDFGYCGQGIAQGGIVDTPEGEWYSIMFQDSGAVGRMPKLVKAEFDKNGYPVFIHERIEDKKSDVVLQPLVASDDFRKGIKDCWQWNHNPHWDCIKINKETGTLDIRSDKICRELTEARNVLTQRTTYPKCIAQVSIDVSNLKEGDIAGISAFQGAYGLIGVTRKGQNLFYQMRAKENSKDGLMEEKIYEEIQCDDNNVTLKMEFNFTDMKDTVDFYYKADNNWKKLGISHKLFFRLDHFTGCRVGLFMYSTKQTGGHAGFSDFKY